MYLRRLRTVMDQLLQSPDTDPDALFLEQRVDELFAPVATLLGEDQVDAVARIKEFLPNQRENLYVTQSIDRTTDWDQIKTIIPEFADGARYFVPIDDSWGTTWTGLSDPVNVELWRTGPTGIGFETEPEAFRDLIKTSVRPSDACATCTSIFVRIPFVVDDPAAISDLTLRMKYDDGFIAYLNGSEVARRHVTGEASYNTRAQGHLDTEAVVFENILISESIDLLRPGENVLAIHAINISPTNSDMLILPELVSGKFGDDSAAGIPHPQEVHPTIRFGAFEQDPSSGNQDQEYFELRNLTEDAVDVSGWQVRGGVRHTFVDGTVIPAKGSLYLSPDAKAFRSRETAPTGGMGLLVQDAYQGHLSNSGEIVQLIAADGTLVDTLQTPETMTVEQRYLRLSELHYNPAGNDDLTEFLEFTNISRGQEAQILDLGGIRIVDGPSDPFTFDDGIQLAPGAHLLVVKNRQQFLAAYPNIDRSQIAGEFSGSLNNAGERIKVNDARGNTILDFVYGDADPWPVRADGAGASLEPIDPSSTPVTEMDNYSWWSGSVLFGGTPGAPRVESPGVVINEVLTNGDPPTNVLDAIELFNPTSEAIDISGWYLSDSADNLRKYQIPAGIVLNPGSYRVFDEQDFNSSVPDPGNERFALSGSRGDDVWLSSSDGMGGLRFFVDDVHFGAARTGESFGRTQNGSGRLAPLDQVTLGRQNADPRVGPIVISEIHYHPAAPSPAALQLDPSITEQDLEFIEIHNPTATATALDQWQLRGGIEYNFSAEVTLAAGETIVVVSFDADAPGNASRAAAFRAEYGIASTIRLLGSYVGRLDNQGEVLQLRRPDSVPQDDPTWIPRLLEDEVLYNNIAPWPANANGNGKSLTRVSVHAYGNAPQNWIGATPTPGTAGYQIGDLTGDGVIDIQDIDRLSIAIQASETEFDLTGDSVTNLDDLLFLVQDILGSSIGDTNLDRFFDTADLVQVLQAGEYEDNIEDNSTWAEGDWNGDGDFTTSDLVLALQTGLYEINSRLNASQVAAAVEWLFAQSAPKGARRAFVA